MTVEEALKITETIDLSKLEITGNTKYIANWGMAIETLREKQIPKKPNTAIINSWEVRSKIKVCPECDCCLSMIYFVETKEGESIKTLYCGRCGQKIDLEEVEE